MPLRDPYGEDWRELSGWQHKLQWLSEQALNCSGLPVVHLRPTVLLEGFSLILTPQSVREINQIRLPFGKSKPSPVAVRDVARVIIAQLENPEPHIGKTYHLTGPAVGKHGFLRAGIFKGARTDDYLPGYSCRAVAGGLLQRGLSDHLVKHLSRMADLHREGRYDRMTDDVFALTGEKPISMQKFVRTMRRHSPVRLKRPDWLCILLRPEAAVLVVLIRCYSLLFPGHAR